jgi:hypothetical protein
MAPISMPRGGVIVAQTFLLTPAKDAGDVANTTARMQFGLAKAKWKIVDCDSQDGADGAPSKAIDDNPTTIWHTRYRDGVDPMPHHVTVDLGEEVTINGFVYAPRQDMWDGGIVTRARFEVSVDGENWTVASDNQDFDNIANSRQPQVVLLPSGMTARYFRLTALRTANDNDVASAAEISVLVE